MIQYSDEELIERIREGQEDYLAQLFTKYRPLMQKEAFNYKLPQMDEDDLLQECRLVLFIAIQSYKKNRQTSFFSYYYKLLERHMWKLSRKYRAKKRMGTQYPALLEAYDWENYTGIGYAKSLTPEALVLVSEQMEESYQALRPGEKKDVLEALTNPQFRESKERGAYKFKKSLKSCR